MTTVSSVPKIWKPSDSFSEWLLVGLCYTCLELQMADVVMSIVTRGAHALELQRCVSRWMDGQPVGMQCICSLTLGYFKPNRVLAFFNYTSLNFTFDDATEIGDVGKGA